MKMSGSRSVILVALIFAVAFGTAPAAGTELEPRENLKSVIKARRLDENEALKLGISTLPAKYRANNNLSEFTVYEADVDNDGASELAVFRFIPDANEPCLPDYCVLTIYKNVKGRYTIFRVMNVDSPKSGNASYDFLLTDLDRNGIVELFFYGDSAGSAGYGDVTVYQWNGSDFSAARLRGDPMVSLEDVEGCASSVVVGLSYMKNSLIGFPCNAMIVYWPDIYKYENYKFVKSNSSFPDYYRKLSLESKEFIKTIKNRTANELTLQYGRYFLALHGQIIRRCGKILNNQQNR